MSDPSPPPPDEPPPSPVQPPEAPPPKAAIPAPAAAPARTVAATSASPRTAPTSAASVSVPKPPEPPTPTPPPPRPAPKTESRPGAPRPPEPELNGAQASRSALPVLTAIGFIFVLLAVAWIWNSELDLSKRVANLPPPPQPAPPGVEPARFAALEDRVNSIEQQLSALKNRPAEPAAAPAAAAPPPDQASLNALTAQMTALEEHLKAAEQRQGKLAEQTALAQRVQEALAALDAGEALGDIPGAPPALSRFAHARPPTEASLRLSFPAAAEAALAASRPSADGKSLGERILMHASSLVTVKESGRVLIGAPAATVLGDAQQKLEAGDVAGCLSALGALDSAAAKAMAGWESDARALLDARAALAQMARG